MRLGRWEEAREFLALLPAGTQDDQHEALAEAVDAAAATQAAEDCRKPCDDGQPAADGTLQSHGSPLLRLPPLARRKPFLGSRPRPDALWETLVQAERSEQPGEDIWQQLRTSVADPAARDYVTGLAALQCGDQATARQSFAACLDHHLPLLNPAAYYLYLYLDSGAETTAAWQHVQQRCHPSELEQLVAHLDKALAALGDESRRQVLHCLANGLPPAEPPTPPSQEPPPAAAADAALAAEEEPIRPAPGDTERQSDGP